MIAPILGAGVRWVGRVDLANPNAPRFGWSGTGFVATVTGSSLVADLATENSADPTYFQPVIDGVAGVRLAVTGTQSVTLANGLADGPHRVELYRETEGQYGNSVFMGFSQGELGEPPAPADRLIEIVGDSISAGFGNLGSEQHPDFGPDPTGGWWDPLESTCRHASLSIL